MSVDTENFSPEFQNLVQNAKISKILEMDEIDFQLLDKMAQEPMSRRREWKVEPSHLARHTKNQIRAIVEGMMVEPNPEKQMIALSIGDPTVFGNLKPPKELVEAIKESVESETFNGYGPSNGFLEARQAIVDYSREVQGDITPSDVIICSGCSCALDICISTIAGPSQNIIIPKPNFPLYRTLAEGLGIEVRMYNLLPEKNWEVDLDHLESQIDQNTAAIIVNNPSNPCGSVFSKQHCLDILSVAERNFIPIIADEIYEHFVFSGKEYVSMSKHSKNVPILSCSGLTKRFLVPGWRCGWIIIHDRNDIFKDLRKGLSNMSMRILGANTMVQGALPSILANTPQTFYDEILRKIHRAAFTAYDLIKNNCRGFKPIMPEGAMYMMIGIDIEGFPEFQDDLSLMQAMIEEQSVFCLPGTVFEMPNYMRIVLTVPEEMIEEACSRMAEFCEKHYRSKGVKLFEQDKFLKKYIEM